MTTPYIELEGRTLAAAMKMVMAVIVSRVNIQILRNVRIRSTSSGLELTATDLDKELTTYVDVMSCDGFLDFTVPGKELAAIARLAGPAPVRIELADEIKETKSAKQPKSHRGIPIEDWQEPRKVSRAIVSVAGGDATYSLDTLPSSDWPEFKPDLSYSIPAGNFTNGRLAELFTKLLPTISTEETRYYLNGIDYKPGRMASTDGHRLTIIHYDKEAAGKWDHIIPTSVCKFLVKFSGSDVKLTAADGPFMQATFERGTLRFRTIDGTFPDIMRVVPKLDDCVLHYEFDADRLRTAIERAALVSGELGRAVKIFETDGEVSVSVGSVDMNASATARTFAKWPAGGVPIGFNHRYLLAFIPKGGTVKLMTADQASPARIVCESPIGDDDGVIRVIMPMRV